MWCAGHGSVLVNVQLDQHGHVVNATIHKSAGQTLDEAALRAVQANGNLPHANPRQTCSRSHCSPLRLLILYRLSFLFERGW
jgi:TonB family protein